jgi:hypothetical protein
MQVMILERDEAALGVERHRFPVDCVDHDNFEPDVSGCGRDLTQRMEQQPGADTLTL